MSETENKNKTIPYGSCGFCDRVQGEHHKANCFALRLDQLVYIEIAYNELLYAVENKYEGETRHQTALRYIREAKSFPRGPGETGGLGV